MEERMKHWKIIKNLTYFFCLKGLDFFQNMNYHILVVKRNSWGTRKRESEKIEVRLCCISFSAGYTPLSTRT